MLIVGIAFSLTVFELLHRVIAVPELISALVLSTIFFPLLVWAIISTVSAILADPDNLGHTIRYAFVFLILTVVFFAVVYTELGIRVSDGSESKNFWTCLYFSVATLTTLGYGDFAPMPEARAIAAVEAVSGYILLGILTAVTFHLISHRAQRRGSS
jgi:hypothetical protein